MPASSPPCSRRRRRTRARSTEGMLLALVNYSSRFVPGPPCRTARAAARAALDRKSISAATDRNSFAPPLATCLPHPGPAILPARRLELLRPAPPCTSPRGLTPRLTPGFARTMVDRRPRDPTLALPILAHAAHTPPTRVPLAENRRPRSRATIISSLAGVSPGCREPRRIVSAALPPKDPLRCCRSATRPCHL